MTDSMRWREVSGVLGFDGKSLNGCQTWVCGIGDRVWCCFYYYYYYFHSKSWEWFWFLKMLHKSNFFFFFLPSKKGDLTVEDEERGDWGWVWSMMDDEIIILKWLLQWLPGCCISVCIFIYFLFCWGIHLLFLCGFPFFFLLPFSFPPNFFIFLLV